MACWCRPRGRRHADELFNGIEHAVTQHATFKLRSVPININYRYTDAEVLYLLDNSDAEVLVFHTSLGERWGFAAALTGQAPPTTPEELLALGRSSAEPPLWLAACPQMHGTGMWLGTMGPARS